MSFKASVYDLIQKWCAETFWYLSKQHKLKIEQTKNSYLNTEFRFF